MNIHLDRLDRLYMCFIWDWFKMHSNFLPMQKFFEITTNTNDHNGNMSFRRLKLVACCHFASHFKTKYHDDYDCYMLDGTQCEGSMNYIFEKMLSF